MISPFSKAGIFLEGKRGIGVGPFASTMIRNDPKKALQVSAVQKSKGWLRRRVPLTQAESTWRIIPGPPIYKGLGPLGNLRVS